MLANYFETPMPSCMLPSEQFPFSESSSDDTGSLPGGPVLSLSDMMHVAKQTAPWLGEEYKTAL